MLSRCSFDQVQKRQVRHEDEHDENNSDGTRSRVPKAGHLAHCEPFHTCSRTKRFGLRKLEVKDHRIESDINSMMDV